MDHQVFAQILGNYGEFVGAIGVVLTLGYLAVQIRQNTRSNRVSAELGTLEQLTSWIRRFSTDKDAQRIWDLVADGSEPISPEDSRQWLWLIGEFFFGSESGGKSARHPIHANLQPMWMAFSRRWGVIGARKRRFVPIQVETGRAVRT
jgi:hypothetical protein